MNKTNYIKLGFTFAGVLALSVVSSKADTFGSGVNTFTIDFVNIGNPGNADDAGGGGGSFSSPYGGVGYIYRMGTYEIPQDAITKAFFLGLAGVTAEAWGASQPAAHMTWFEAASFVNFLNTSTGHHAAYDMGYSVDYGVTALRLWDSAQAWQTGGENLFRHKDAYYFLPSEDEWYKAAYHQNDGVTANYWDYATGSNTSPAAVASGTVAETSAYGGVTGDALTGSPANVDNDGGLSPYGTRGQNGNVTEWQESAYDGVNDSPFEPRTIRGGFWGSSAGSLISSTRTYEIPIFTGSYLGFRVASAEVGTGSVPEPSSGLLLLGSGLAGLLQRHRRDTGAT